MLLKCLQEQLSFPFGIFKRTSAWQDKIGLTSAMHEADNQFRHQQACNRIVGKDTDKEAQNLNAKAQRCKASEKRAILSVLISLVPTVASFASLLLRGFALQIASA